jgi:primosomal protein N' (replication factor Y)
VQFLGTGTEKVEHELHEAFPGARIARLDRDTASGKQRFEEILSGFRNGEFDILTGTQMIAKGHDIPRVTLVGVINADIGLTMPDFRAAERCFQLLTQVAGRAGRGDLAGRVLMQTLNPDHYAIRFAAAQDYEGFYAREIEFRRALRYPPYAALANVLVRHEDLELAQRITGEVGLFFQRAREGMKVLGPAAAAVPRLKSEHRFQCLVKANSRQRLNEALQQLRRHALEQKWPAASLVIDVDPVSLL